MAVLSVKNLKKNFGSTEVLKGVSFELEKGQVLSVVGSSGGGKTTLLRCLNFLETPDSGEICVNGETVFSCDGKEPPIIASDVQKSFGLVFQQFNLFPQYTAFENICLAPKLHAASRPDFKERRKEIYAEIEENATKLLAKTGLSEKAHSYPCELSGGQQQRVAIARALALSPLILCFDEPTSALDPELTGEVLKVIRALKDSDRTMIVVTHEMEFARDVSDVVIYMADGHIEEFGTPEQVFDAPKSEKTKAFLSK